MNDYPPSGVLFTNTRKKPDTKQPDYTGNLELSVDVVKDLQRQISDGSTKPKLALAGWKKVSQKGQTFISMNGSVFEEKEKAPF